MQGEARKKRVMHIDFCVCCIVLLTYARHILFDHLRNDSCMIPTVVVLSGCSKELLKICTSLAIIVMAGMSRKF